MTLQHLPPLKAVRFLGGSRDSIRAFPKEARQEAGDQLLMVQAGNMPEDWKAMPDVGTGVFEIRIHKPNEYRVLYVAKFAEAVYVLDAFEKKTRKTPQKELEKARKAYAEVLKERRR